MSTKIFLSYRHGIDDERSERVKRHLVEIFGAASVLDQAAQSSPGQYFRERLHGAIQDCDSVLVLIGPDWLSAADAQGRPRLDNPDDPVRLEVAAALEAGKTVIPVLLDGARMPRAEQLPARLAPLSELSAMEVDTGHLEASPLWQLNLRAPPPDSTPAESPPGLDEMVRAQHSRMPSLFGSAAEVVAGALRAAGRLAGALIPAGAKKAEAPQPPKDRAARTPKMAPAPTDASDSVWLGVTAPRSCLPGGSFNAVLAVYVEAARASAQAKLERLGGTAGVPLMDIPPDRQSGWVIGAPVTVRLTASYADIEPAERSFEWSGRENLAAFKVRIHHDAAGGELDLCFHVALANMPIASIPLPVALTAAGPAESPRVENIRTAGSAFASYASKDAQTVGYCLSTLTRWSPGLSIFQDCLDLNPNETFKPQLASRIGSSDVFMLFWSRNASASPWVRWEYDTARMAKGLSAVIPMPLEDPRIAPPPPEFEDAHMRDRFMVARYALARIDDEAEGKVSGH